MPSLSDKIKAATAGDELEWIPRNNIPTQNELSALTEEFSREYGMESELQAKAKLPAWEKIKENPFVPLGCLVTALILTFGLLSMKERNHKKAQLFMRARVLSQGFTFSAIVGGMWYQASKTKQPKHPK